MPLDNSNSSTNCLAVGKSPTHPLTHCLQLVQVTSFKPAAQASSGAAAEQAAPDSTTQHTDTTNDQAAYIQKQLAEAFEVSLWQHSTGIQQVLLLSLAALSLALCDTITISNTLAATHALLLLPPPKKQAGFKAGYQRGAKVQVSVSVELDDTSGSYLRRQQSGRQQRSNGNGGGGSRSSSSSQPWLPAAAKPAQGSPQSPAAGASAAADNQAPSQSAAAGDSLMRSVIKGFVWRIFSTTVTVSVALLVLHDSLQVSDAVKFGGIEFATKYVMYVLHERLWAAIAVL